MEKIVVKTEKKMRIDKYLAEELSISRSQVAKQIENGCFLINGVVAKASDDVKDGSVIERIKEYHEDLDIVPEDIKLDIVYEDDDVILINKPSDMVVHPGSGNFHGTMVNALLHYTKSLSDCNGDERPGIVHRIDKDTSGLILVAKNNEAHRILAKDFETKRVQRKYIALVDGVLPHNHITIDAPIGRDNNNRQKMAVKEGGKNAITHVNVIKRYSRYTLVECVLETGRTHQIRVHMAYIGYPIHNDPVYNKKEATSFGQFLHSSEITFVSPITKKELHFKVDLPKEFKEFLDKIENEDKYN